MKLRARPEQIDEILNSLDTDDETMTELQKYIADLEAKQPDRPSRIIRCLEEVELHHSAEVVASLEAYLSELEANQQPVPLGNKTKVSNESRYWHSVRREKERKARALRKQNNTWKPL
jgi:hypothetical protein